MRFDQLGLVGYQKWLLTEPGFNSATPGKGVIKDLPVSGHMSTMGHLLYPHSDNTTPTPLDCFLNAQVSEHFQIIALTGESPLASKLVCRGGMAYVNSVVTHSKISNCIW